MVMRIVVTEEQKKGISHKLMGMIDNNGLLNTIKFIDLIKEIIGLDEQHPVYGGGGRIYLSEVDSDILYDEFDGDDGHTFESYIDFIENYNDNLFAHVTVWEFDEDGQMYDEYFDDYDVRVNKLETKYLNKLFEMLVNNYLS